MNRVNSKGVHLKQKYLVPYTFFLLLFPFFRPSSFTAEKDPNFGGSIQEHRKRRHSRRIDRRRSNKGTDKNINDDRLFHKRRRRLNRFYHLLEKRESGERVVVTVKASQKKTKSGVEIDKSADSFDSGCWLQRTKSEREVLKGGISWTKSNFRFVYVHRITLGMQKLVAVLSCLRGCFFYVSANKKMLYFPKLILFLSLHLSVRREIKVNHSSGCCSFFQGASSGRSEGGPRLNRLWTSLSPGAGRDHACASIAPIVVVLYR